MKILVTGSAGSAGSVGFVKGEMLKTHGSNNMLKKNFKNLKFTNLQLGLKKTILSYKKFSY